MGPGCRLCTRLNLVICSGKTLAWPAGDGAPGHAGAAAVYRTPFSIGYVEQACS